MTTHLQNPHSDLACMDVLHQRLEGHGSFNGCPIMYTANIIRRKWAIQIIYHLYKRNIPMRYSEVERGLVPITQKELTKRLKELESAGIVSRTVYPEVPPHVEYTLTAAGHALVSALDALTLWGERYRNPDTPSST
jgi:DNA-binding HxlR family transcriptional regulator